MGAKKKSRPMVDVLTEDEWDELDDDRDYDDDELDDDEEDDASARPTRVRRRIIRKPTIASEPTVAELLRAVNEVPARTVALLRAEMRTPPRVGTPPQVISHDEDGDGKDDVIEVITNPDPRANDPRHDPAPRSEHFFYRKMGRR